MLVLSVDHRSAELTAIAELGRRSAELYARLNEDPSVRGVVVLTTCGRIEAYVDAASFHGPQRAFISTLSVDPTLVTSRRGIDALEHLFRVAAGLESAVVGETQVAGQVRDAMLAARARGSSTRTLDLAFENAIRVSRQSRAILSANPTVASVALDSIDTGAAPLGTALVIGTGAFARACIAELRVRGAHTIWSHSPSGRRELPLGADDVIDADDLVSALALSDVTVAASGHGPDVITEVVALRALALRSTPLVLVDLAAAGDAAITLDDDPDVHVVRISDVSRAATGTHAVDELIVAEARTLYPRIEGSELDDLIVRLRKHVHDIALSELGSDPDPAAVEAIRRITQTLLHDPTQRAREAAVNGQLERYRSALETVFGLDVSVAIEAGSAA